MSRSLTIALALLPCALLTAGCGSSFMAVDRQPDASLLLPCVDPVLVAEPDVASDNDIAAERLRVAQAYLACKRRHADLATFVKGGQSDPK